MTDLSVMAAGPSLIGVLTRDGYLLGGGLLAVGVGLLALLASPHLLRLVRWAVARHRRTVEARARARRQARRPAPVRPPGAHRAIRVLRPVVPAPAPVAPRPRPAVEQTRVMPPWKGPTWQHPNLAGSPAPRQRGVDGA